jgi:hypothetical protein
VLGNRVGRRKHRGVAPDPPRAVALGVINLGGCGRRAYRDLSTSGQALLPHPPMDRFQRASPFDGGPGGSASCRVSGQRPATSSLHPMPPHGTSGDCGPPRGGGRSGERQPEGGP